MLRINKYVPKLELETKFREVEINIMAKYTREDEKRTHPSCPVFNLFFSYYNIVN